MSKRDPLRQLIKKFPPPKELKGIIEGLQGEPDRSAAIIAAAVVEGVLERIIVHRLQNKNTNLIGQLFNNRGPLSDLHSKILIASAFGIISPNAEADCHRIKIIRNVFAHAIQPVTFESPEIVREIEEFIVINAMHNFTKEFKWESKILPKPEINFRGKAAYLLAAHIFCIVYDSRHQNLGGEPILEIYEKQSND